MNQSKLDRINELYKKSQEKGLSEEEKAEQDRLRKEYVLAVRKNLRGTLETIKIQNPDGTITDLKEKGKGNAN